MSLVIKSLPRLLLSPYVGAVRGAREEIERSDVELAACKASYFENLQKLDGR